MTCVRNNFPEEILSCYFSKKYSGCLDASERSDILWPVKVREAFAADEKTNHSWVTLSAYLCFPAYVLPVKVEMEMMIQQYEKAKVIQDEQLERLTQICQEQGVKFSYVCIYA